MMHAAVLMKWLWENPQEWFKSFHSPSYDNSPTEPTEPTKQQQDHIEHLKETL